MPETAPAAILAPDHGALALVVPCAWTPFSMSTWLPPTPYTSGFLVSFPQIPPAFGMIVLPHQHPFPV